MLGVPGAGNIPLIAELPHFPAARYMRKLEVIASEEVTTGYLMKVQ